VDENVLLTMKQQQKLDQISQWYSNRNWGFYTKLVYFDYLTLKPFLNNGSMLEVGSADGEMTKFLLPHFDKYTVVEGAKKYVDAVKKIDPKIKAVCSMIEDFETDERFDHIMFAHVLEHVVDPVKVLIKLKSLLTTKGQLYIIVPNANSLHRQAGVAMGLIDRPTSLNEADISVDHKRVYTPGLLAEHCQQAGLTITQEGGIFLKPLSNSQIQEQWTDSQIEAYYQLGKNYPEIASEIFAVCH
jgi:2-polyprenyl-3-methyl-5-hydroxy-6-metoxy-1,4-benzoquinol methylase